MDFRIERFALKLPIPSFLKKSGAPFRVLAERAPQLEAWAVRTVEIMRPGWERVYRVRRQFATALVGLLTVWLFVHVMFGANGMVVYKQKKNDIQGLQKQIDDLQKENDHYTTQIKALQSDPKMIEKVAREQLQYTRPGEVVYVGPDTMRREKPAIHSARK